VVVIITLAERKELEVLVAVAQVVKVQAELLAQPIQAVVAAVV
tara:strand:- start:13 stop:141 length:129 start_codon:yes stop_codon:yes gene_type:complete